MVKNVIDGRSLKLSPGRLHLQRRHPRSKRIRTYPDRAQSLHLGSPRRTQLPRRLEEHQSCWRGAQAKHARLRTGHARQRYCAIGFDRQDYSYQRIRELVFASQKLEQGCGYVGTAFRASRKAPFEAAIAPAIYLQLFTCRSLVKEVGMGCVV